MSHAQIPDLWPESLRVDVLTPYAVLSAQATKLTEKTQGLVEGRVTTRALPPGLWLHIFDLVAPVLSFRYTLFRLWHRESMPYPAVLWRGREPSTKPSDIARALSEDRMEPGSDLIWNEEKLLHALQGVFQNPVTLSVVESLISRSNEVRQGGAPKLETETQGTEDDLPESKSLTPDALEE